MPDTPIVTLRFPDGEVEYRSTRGELPIGVLVRSRGTYWRVSRYVEGTAFLEPASADDPFQHGPKVTPSPLGDEPFLLETILET
jgi:hypothetical protein